MNDTRELNRAARNGNSSRIEALQVIRFMLDPKFRRDPYPLYKRLRSREPVHHSMMGVTLVSSYEGVSQLLRHPATSSNELNADLRIRAGRSGRGVIGELPGRTIMALAGRAAARHPDNVFTDMNRRFLISIDPPDHTRIRGLASRAFTPRIVETSRPMIESVAARLIDRIRDQPATSREPVDLMSEFAYPLTIEVVCQLLGVPVEDYDRFAEWVPPLVRGIDVEGLASKERAAAAEAAATSLDKYFRGIISERRSDPRDDLLSQLVIASGSDDPTLDDPTGDNRLSEEELVAFAILLFGAGHETTANLIGNGLVQLFGHPGELARFRDDPTCRRNGVEELVRFDSPVQLVQRTSLEQIEIDGETIPAGRLIIGLLGSANRDPDRFERPDELDLEREHCQPMSFGFGIHHCIGAWLARAEAEIALSMLLEQFDGLRLAVESPRWRPSIIFRGLESLPVRWN